MPDIKLTVSVDVAGVKTGVAYPTITAEATDRVTVTIPKATGTPAKHTIKTAPKGLGVSFVSIVASFYGEGTTKGLRIYKTDADTDGIPLTAPIVLAGHVGVALTFDPLELIVANESTTTDIRIDIQVARRAET